MGAVGVKGEKTKTGDEKMTAISDKANNMAQSLTQENKMLTGQLMLQISSTEELRRDNESLRKICEIQSREIQRCHDELENYIKLPFGLRYYKGAA
jgi:dynactin complex subunit